MRIETIAPAFELVPGLPFDERARDVLAFLPPVSLDRHAEDQDSKTEEASETRIRKAREEGQVFMTAELPQAAEMLLGVCILLLFSSYYMREMKNLMVTYLLNPQGMDVSEAGIQAMFTQIVWVIAKLFAPVGVTAAAAVAIATLGQTRFHFSTRRLAFKFDRILPTFENFKQKTVFTRAGVIQNVKAVIKVILIGVLAGLLFFYRLDEMVSLGTAEPVAGFIKTSYMVFELVAYVCGLLLLLAVPDYFLQRAEFMRNLRMTPQEKKEEYKEQEGDPQIKAKQMERMRDVRRRKMLKDVADADVVVVNPIHFAVALRVDLEENRGPRVVAKGEGRLAELIKEKAEEAGVPIRVNVPLARRLYKESEVGSVVDGRYYAQIASLLTTLERFRERLSRTGGRAA